MDPKRKSRATLVEFLAQMVAAVEYIHKTSSLVVISFFSPSVSLVKRNQPNDIRPNPRSVAFRPLPLLLRRCIIRGQCNRREVALLIITKGQANKAADDLSSGILYRDQYIWQLCTRERKLHVAWLRGSYLIPADRITSTVYVSKPLLPPSLSFDKRYGCC